MQTRQGERSAEVFTYTCSHSMLHPNLIFRKTEAGSAEIASRTLGLRADLRRLLILVDGRNTVSRLATLVRAPNIEALLLELHAQKLIEATDAAAITPSVDATASASATSAAPSHSTESVAAADGPAMLPTLEQFLAARAAAVRFVNEVLGPEGETLALKLDLTRDPQTLRDAVSQVRQSLDQMMGAAEGQRFLETVRAAAKL